MGSVGSLTLFALNWYAETVERTVFVEFHIQNTKRKKGNIILTYLMI